MFNAGMYACGVCRNVYTVKCYISIYIGSTKNLSFAMLKLEAPFLDDRMALVIHEVL